jgi:hypothetical protein
MATVLWQFKFFSDPENVHENTVVACGPVWAFEEGDETARVRLVPGIGLRGELTWPVHIDPEHYQPIQLELVKVEGRNTIAEIGLMSGKTRTLDDPMLSVGWNPRVDPWSDIVQKWDDGDEFIEIWLQSLPYDVLRRNRNLLLK